MQNAEAEEIDVGSPIHLPFEQLEASDLPFHLPGAPWLCEGCQSGSQLIFETKSKPTQFFCRACLGPLQKGEETPGCHAS